MAGAVRDDPWPTRGAPEQTVRRHGVDSAAARGEELHGPGKAGVDPRVAAVGRLEQSFSDASGVHRARLHRIERERVDARDLQAGLQPGPQSTAITRAKRGIAAERTLPWIHDWKIRRPRRARDMSTP